MPVRTKRRSGSLQRRNRTLQSNSFGRFFKNPLVTLLCKVNLPRHCRAMSACGGPSKEAAALSLKSCQEAREYSIQEMAPYA